MQSNCVCQAVVPHDTLLVGWLAQFLLAQVQADVREGPACLAHGHNHVTDLPLGTVDNERFVLGHPSVRTELPVRATGCAQVGLDLPLPLASDLTFKLGNARPDVERQLAFACHHIDAVV
jgi:hypothetical protein